MIKVSGTRSFRDTPLRSAPRRRCRIPAPRRPVGRPNWRIPVKILTQVIEMWHSLMCARRGAPVANFARQQSLELEVRSIFG